MCELDDGEIGDDEFDVLLLEDSRKILLLGGVLGDFLGDDKNDCLLAGLVITAVAALFCAGSVLFVDISSSSLLVDSGN